MAPSGITQRGLFDVAGDAAAGSFFGASISFPLELASGPIVVEVPWGGPNPDPTHCPGSADAPAAAGGYLCLYDRIVDNVTQPTGTNLQVQDVDGNGGTASPFGARLTARAASSGRGLVGGYGTVKAGAAERTGANGARVPPSEDVPSSWVTPRWAAATRCQRIDEPAPDLPTTSRPPELGDIEEEANRGDAVSVGPDFLVLHQKTADPPAVAE
jgi:hypothetical protein